MSSDTRSCLRTTSGGEARRRTQVDDVGRGDAADARGRGAHAHAHVAQHGGVQLGGVDVDDAEGHGEAKLTGHLQS